MRSLHRARARISELRPVDVRFLDAQQAAGARGSNAAAIPDARSPARPPSRGVVAEDGRRTAAETIRCYSIESPNSRIGLPPLVSRTQYRPGAGERVSFACMESPERSGVPLHTCVPAEFTT